MVLLSQDDSCDSIVLTPAGFLFPHRIAAGLCLQKCSMLMPTGDQLAIPSSHVALPTATHDDISGLLNHGGHCISLGV